MGSNSAGGMVVCCECCVLSGRGLCGELITRPEEPYRLWCVVVCDLETSRMRGPWPALDCSATGGKIFCICSISTGKITLCYEQHMVRELRVGRAWFIICNSTGFVIDYLCHILIRCFIVVTNSIRRWQQKKCAT